MDRANLDTESLADKIRRHSVQMTSSGNASHVGSCLSIADILAVLYGRVLNVRPNDPQWLDRDRFVLSKGHAAAALYAALAETGFMPVTELATHCQDGSRLMGHASHAVPGIELSTGSLGHGLPVTAGFALAAKLRGRAHRAVALLSDGECDEGSNWEAAMFSAHHKLDNLLVVVDYNKIQSLKSISETLELEPFADKWRSFGFNVAECDGHDHKALFGEMSKLLAMKGKPGVLLCHTIKGYGVSFMERKVLWHYRWPQGQELADALSELDKKKH